MTLRSSSLQFAPTLSGVCLIQLRVYGSSTRQNASISQMLAFPRHVACFAYHNAIQSLRTRLNTEIVLENDSLRAQNDNLKVCSAHVRSLTVMRTHRQGSHSSGPIQQNILQVVPVKYSCVR